jgi:O-acetyl-ADP-ribose deacetylase (regulator of RNase III)
MVNEVIGDLFESDAVVLIHGCNSQGVMSWGIAKTFREKYPEAYNEYKRIKLVNRKLVLGENIYVKINNARYVVNMITQENYGYDGAPYASYSAIESCLTKLYNWMDEQGIKSVAAPWVGTGLGGLDKERVREIIYRITPEYIKLTVYSLD